MLSKCHYLVSKIHCLTNQNKPDDVNGIGYPNVWLWLPVKCNVSVVEYVHRFSLVKFKMFSEAEVITGRPINISQLWVGIVTQLILQRHEDISLNTLANENAILVFAIQSPQHLTHLG